MGISELGINYRKSPIVHEDRSETMGLHDFPGPRAGDRVPDIPLDAVANNGAARLFDLLRGTRHHLLLFEGDRPTPADYENLGTLTQQVRDRLGPWVEPRIVIGTANNVGTRSWNLPVVLDSNRSIHHRFGASTTCSYLIRPDGYVGYRSASANAERLWAYIDRLLIAD